MRVVPVGTRLRAFFVDSRGDAFLDLTSEVRSAHPGGSFGEALTVAALVNAVTTNLRAVRRVQLLVEGEEVETLAGHCRRLAAARARPVAGRQAGAALTSALALADMRADNRLPEQLRPSRITPNYLAHAEGSVLVEAGHTKVICTASVEDRVPPFRRGSGKGWVTAEYGMLPRATSTRTQREAAAGKVGGRTQEIQRLIGRSLRAVTKLEELGERTITLDCDVIQADGGTRTASITGAYVALVLALQHLRERELLRSMPVTDFVAATSVGIVDGEPMLDLAYVEDSKADVDMNIIKTGSGLYVEVQGTAEALPFGREALNRLLDLADGGIRQLVALQRGLVGQHLGKP